MLSELPVLTPEKTIVLYPLASLPVRIIAHLLDLVVVFAIIVAVGYAATALALIELGLAVFVWLTVGLIVPFAYFVLLEGLWNGRTLGKHAMALRVCMADGTPITFGSAVGRNFVRFGDFLPSFYFVGFAAILTNPRSQRLGDIVANTVVIYEPRAKPEFAPSPHKAGIHFVEPLLPDLRHMSIEDYQALRRFVDRFPEFSQGTQQRLLAEFWVPFATKHRVPPMPGVDPVEVAGGVVMKFGREKGLL